MRAVDSPSPVIFGGAGPTCVGLMNRCKSAPGKHLFKYWILRPLKLRRTIEERQEAVGWMIDNIVSRGYLAEVRKLLQGVNRIELILGNLSGQNSHQGFKDLLKVGVPVERGAREAASLSSRFGRYDRS